MNFSFLYKWALVLGLLLGHVVTVFAQDANMDRAKHVYELFVADQGDSIHALLNKNLQEKSNGLPAPKHPPKLLWGMH